MGKKYQVLPRIYSLPKISKQRLLRENIPLLNSPVPPPPLFPYP